MIAEAYEIGANVLSTGLELKKNAVLQVVVTMLPSCEYKAWVQHLDSRSKK